MIRKNKKSAGFTLMELLVVIAIIAILATALVVGINPARHFRAARNSTRWSHMNAISSAIYSYAVEHGGAFPAGCIGEPAPATPISIIAGWCTSGGGVVRVVPDYLRVIPEDPLAGQSYQIQFVDAGRTGIKITSTADEAAGVELIQ